MKNKSKNVKIERTLNDANLYSYNKNVCCISFSTTGELMYITLGKYWDFSITTRKHVYDFLNDFNIDVNNKNVVENAIENGFIVSNGYKISLYYDGGME